MRGRRAHPHGQCEDAASAEPRCEQGSVRTARSRDVALLMVPYSRGWVVSARRGAAAPRPVPVNPKTTGLGRTQQVRAAGGGGDRPAIFTKAGKPVSKQATQRQPGPRWGRHHSLASASGSHLSTLSLYWVRGSSNLHILSYFPEAPALPKGHLPRPSFPGPAPCHSWSSNRNRKSAEIPTVRRVHLASRAWGTSGQDLLCALLTTLTQATLPTDEDLIEWP